jgi:hypothetical protein
MRAESAVEPTRSLTALGGIQRQRCGTWRNGDRGCVLLDGFEIGNRTQQVAAMAERRNTNLFEVLIGQVT